MINKKNVNTYCSEDISLIENYEQAINDKTQTWDCHHRKETDENISVPELIKLDLYFNRPANELIFLTPTEHRSLHTYLTFKGKPKSKEWKKKMSEANKGKNKGKTPWTKGKPSTIRNKHRVYDNKELNIYHYE